MTREEIRRQGIEALTRESGPVGVVRFLPQFETGQGDYSTERRQWLADDLSAVVEELKEVDLSEDQP